MVINRSIPEGTFIPSLSYTQDAGTVVEWLTNAFGVTERFRAGDEHAQISLENGGCLISGQRASLSASNAMYITVRVPNVNALYQRAKDFGVEITMEPTSFPYGEKQFGARDLGGHLWNFSESIQDVDPETWATLPKNER